ncbi:MULTISPECIES: cyd operon protein YbgE [Vibrio]|uniref:Cyd operon protein YbgE n=1 Tax=Vibrio ostreae TaxID=2841925 RepID=A0A975YPQ8_9VIBR|nr:MULTISPECIES: cyd operon protein YbgE [Vibrio]QXO19053.1 cyd operon protein YbgE [Vibrio ostreae]
MSNWSTQLANLHAPVDKTLIKVLSLVLGFYHVAMVMWDPAAYSSSIGGFNAFVAPLLIWAVCSSMVFGVGFKPRSWIWQLVFSPYISLPILLYLLGLRLS